MWRCRAAGTEVTDSRELPCGHAWQCRKCLTVFSLCGPGFCFWLYFIARADLELWQSSCLSLSADITDISPHSHFCFVLKLRITLCKVGDLISDPSVHTKARHGRYIFEILTPERQRQEDRWTYYLAIPAKLMSSRFSERPCLRKYGGEHLTPPLASTCHAGRDGSARE